MKKFFSVFCTLAIGLFAASSCIEDEYDLEKKIDKTIELKNFTFALKETYTFNIKDILLAKYPVAALLIEGTDITVTLEDGVLGEFNVDGIADDLTTDYIFKHGVVTATVINGLPEPFSATAVAVDKSGNALSNITATCSPSTIPVGTSQITVDVKSNGNINFDGVRFALKMDAEKVKFSSSQSVTVKDFVISFPDGISKKSE
ncbi:MAG: hypothetical protein IJ151_00595 [Bacteroidales bacterium]|nr:hypothetical protein [Bacteroidales bacterium]